MQVAFGGASPIVSLKSIEEKTNTKSSLINI